MKLDGIKRKEVGCCPGHDKFPTDTYRNRRSVHARAKGIQLTHQTQRARSKAALVIEMKELIREEL